MSQTPGQNEPRIDGEEIAQGIVEWVEIESPSTDKDAVNRMADRVEQQCREVGLAMEASGMLAERDIPVRVVSMPSTDVFDAQSAAYRESVLPAAVKARVSVEAGVTDYWRKYIGDHGRAVGVDGFGLRELPQALDGQPANERVRVLRQREQVREHLGVLALDEHVDRLEAHRRVGGGGRGDRRGEVRRQVVGRRAHGRVLDHWRRRCGRRRRGGAVPKALDDGDGAAVPLPEVLEQRAGSYTPHHLGLNCGDRAEQILVPVVVSAHASIAI